MMKRTILFLGVMVLAVVVNPASTAAVTCDTTPVDIVVSVDASGSLCENDADGCLCRPVGTKKKHLDDCDCHPTDCTVDVDCPPTCGYQATRDWLRDIGDLLLSNVTRIAVRVWARTDAEFLPMTGSWTTYRAAIDHVPYTGGATYTDRALRGLAESFLKDDDEARHVAIVLTDGECFHSGKDPECTLDVQRRAAADLRRAIPDITIVGVGVSPRCRSRCLAGLRSFADVVVVENDLGKLNSTLAAIYNVTCVPTPSPPPPSPDPDPEPEPDPVLSPPPAPVVTGIPPALLIAAGAGTVGLLGAAAALARRRRRPRDLPEAPGIDVDEPLPMLSMFQDTDTGVMGSPPAPDNRPAYAPASHVVPRK